MSGKDESSVFAIDAVNKDSQRPENKKVPPASSKKTRTKGVRAGQSDDKKKLTELKAGHRKEIQALKSKHRVEYKAVQSELREQLRKSKVAIKDATEGSKKFYEGQLRQMRADYTNQNEALRTELKKFLENSVDEIAKNYETRLANESNERLDNLKSMIHDDFVEAMQKKADEIEQIRTESEAEIARIAQENNEKGHRITQLELKMKEISHYLPEDIQEDVFEQFGFKAEMDGLEDKPKAKRKGLLARLRSRR
jgi:hypothetical protein